MNLKTIFIHTNHLMFLKSIWMRVSVVNPEKDSDPISPSYLQVITLAPSLSLSPLFSPILKTEKDFHLQNPPNS